jgi:hypothetical protein
VNIFWHFSTVEKKFLGLSTPKKIFTDVHWGLDALFQGQETTKNPQKLRVDTRK